MRFVARCGTSVGPLGIDKVTQELVARFASDGKLVADF